MRWDQGRADIERMLAERRLQRVPASRAHAERMLAQARRHLMSAQEVCGNDPEGGYALLYDAERKALAAVLGNEGLRPTSAGGHLAVYEAVRAQLDLPMGTVLSPFDRMRRQRRDVEYPQVDAPELSAADVREDVPKVQAILDLAVRVLDGMSPF
jgi:hypothetical protein